MASELGRVDDSLRAHERLGPFSVSMASWKEVNDTSQKIPLFLLGICSVLWNLLEKLKFSFQNNLKCW